MNRTRRQVVHSLLRGSLGVGIFAAFPSLAVSPASSVKAPMSNDADLPDLVLCIPGPWKDRAELLKAIVERSKGYLFAGRVLMHTETKFTCELVHEEADSRMPVAFAAAGPHWKTSPEMTAIGEHRSVVYLVGKGGSQLNAEAMMLAARGLLLAGGLGVKVESSGISHSPRAWLEFTDNIHLFTAHQAFVLYVTGSDVYSCGMHNFGLRDAITSGVDRAEAVELLRVFTRYLFTESPTIRAGQTFGVEADAPVYRIGDDPGVQYDSGSLFRNTYGYWRLSAAARR